MNLWLDLKCLIESTSYNLIAEQESFVLCANCMSALFQAQLFPCERCLSFLSPVREVIRCLYLTLFHLRLGNASFPDEHTNAEQDTFVISI